MLQQYLPFTVLKPIINWNGNFILLLQQYLPFTVLKLKIECIMQKDKFPELQQYLPFTVLKLFSHYLFSLLKSKVATVLTVYGIETGYVMNVIIFRTTCVATVLTVYGIETGKPEYNIL